MSRGGRHHRNETAPDEKCETFHESAVIVPGTFVNIQSSWGGEDVDTSRIECALAIGVTDWDLT